jgi:hypothetical protein
MPIHDWNRVDAGIFHDFHTRWIAHLVEALNEGLLPKAYYALAEQRSGQNHPDVLTLKSADGNGSKMPSPGNGAVALADAPPRAAMTMRPVSNEYALKRRTLTIRHVSGDRVVALIEIVSKANKDRGSTVRDFAEKVVSALRQRIHVLVVDVFPPGPHDPTGMHGAVWNEIDEGQPYEMPPDKPLTVASYVVNSMPVAYVEPLAIGDELPEMALFLDPDWYIKTPLEPTYRLAYRGVPDRWRQIIEA